jgi:hypothetical protein
VEAWYESSSLKPYPAGAGIGSFSVRSGASRVAVLATDVRDPTTMTPASTSVDHVQPADPVLDGEQDAYGQDDEPDPGRRRNEPAKDEQTNTIAKPMRLPPASSLAALAMFTRPGLSFPVGIALQRSGLEC